MERGVNQNSPKLYAIGFGTQSYKVKNKRNLIGLLIIAVLIISTVFTSGCVKQGQRSPQEIPAPETSTSTPTPALKLMTAREAYDLAVEHAREEYGSVYLYQLTAGGGTVGLSTLKQKVGDDGRASSWDVNFMLFHPDNGTRVLVLAVIENGEVTRVSTSKPLEMYFDLDSYLRSDLIDMEKVKVSGAEAVRIADENGGGEFTRIMLRLVKTGGHPRWIVAFGPGTREKGEHPGIFIRIDAETGEVVGKKTKMYHIL